MRLASRHSVGVAMVLISAVAWSFSGLFTRCLSVDVFAAVAWRGFFGGTILLIVLAIASGRETLSRLLSIGWPGLATVAILAVSQGATVSSLFLTSVANVTVIYATTPFLAAGLAYLFLGERIDRRTAIASAVAFLGVLIVVSGSLSGGHLLGDALALVMALSFAVVILMPRAFPSLDVQAITVLASFATFAGSLPFAETGRIDAANWLLLLMYGAVNIGLAFFMFMEGSKRFPAVQSGMITTLEIVLSPFWVFLVFREVPNVQTMIGGGLVLVTIAWQIVMTVAAGDRQSEAIAISPKGCVTPP